MTGDRERGWNRAAAAVAVIAALLAIVWLAREPILVRVARFVEVDQPVLASDAIYLLSGDARVAGRAEHAARLYHAGAAPIILIARPEDPPATHRGLYPNDADANAAILRQDGVPAHAIRMMIGGAGVTSTREEGRMLDWYLRQNPGVERITIVTSAYHTRRALRTIRQETQGRDAEVRISAAQDPRFHARNWWRTESGLLAYFEEYVKLVLR